MTNKLEYLSSLKNNTGGEQAQMLSDDVTKVMEEQSNYEGQYADLIARRGQLKGISNKPELMKCKAQINDIAYKLKVSTNDLCGKLADNPDSTGNN